MTNTDDDDFDRGNPLAAEMGEDGPPNELREVALAKLRSFWLRALHLLYAYNGNREMAFDCFMFAMGQGSKIGLKSAVEISKKHFADGDKKQTTNKCVKYFQKRLGIPPMPGQRSKTGRAGMATARKSQLKSKPHESDRIQDIP